LHRLNEFHQHKDQVHLTLGDLTRAKLGPPTAPSTPAELCDVLEKMYRVLTYLFTTNCPLAYQLAQVTAALRQQSGIMAMATNRHNFIMNKGPAILQAITDATTHFFQQLITKEQLMAGEHPKVTLEWVAANILTRQAFQLDAIANQYYCRTALDSLKPPAVPALPELLPPPPRPSDNPRPSLVNRQLDSRLKKVVDEWNAATHMTMTLNKVLLPGLGIPNIDQLCRECQLDSNDCLRWAILGECSGRCKKRHSNQIKSNDFLERLLKEIPNLRQAKRSKTNQ
jgi:hypothetical protein